MRIEINGRCHCGRIGYDAEVDPEKVVLCHCTDCQTMSGAPYRANVPVLIENFKLSGQPKVYEKTGGSGRKVSTAFCGDCGSALYSARQGATFLFLRLGAVKQRAQLVPKSQGFCRSAMPWAFDINNIPRLPEPPRGTDQTR